MAHAHFAWRACWVLVLVFIASFNAAAQADKNALVVGTKKTAYSKSLSEARTVWVHVPGNVKKGATDKRYPVVYVLDGEDHFYTVTGLLHQLSEATGNTTAPQMIVVGIASPDRTRDFTPTHYVSGPGTDSVFARTSGGANAFTTYLETELLPYIDSVYPTAPYRMLVGHSLGGLLVVNTLLNHANLFNAYVALEPSLWWDGNLMLKQAAARLHTPAVKNKSLYLAVANTASSMTDTAAMRADTTEETLQYRSQLQFAALLATQKDSNALRFRSRYYPDENHISIPLIGLYDGFRFLFDFHRMVAFNRLWEPGFNADSSFRAHYATISARMGYTVHPPRELLDGLGHAFMEYGMPEKALGLFTINQENYPRKAESYTALGDWYAARGDAKKARAYYQQSLALKTNTAVQKKRSALATSK